MNSRFSDAALAYWAKVYPGNNLRIPTISTYDAALAAFDAGCAHALATVTPRTISTESELDALPVGQKVEDCDGDGYAKNKNGEWECYSVDHRRVWISEALAMYAPLTLLVPTTAAPEPVRPDDDPPPADHEVGALLDIAQSMARLDPATQARIARYVFERWADA